MTRCGVRGGYADWECVLTHGHDGQHLDGIGRCFDAAPWTPVIEPTRITLKHAEDALDEHGSEGVVTIDGVKVSWWADDGVVWFFNPDDDPDLETDERILAIFEVETTVVRVR